MIKDAYEYGRKHHYNPDQVVQHIKDRDDDAFKIYMNLKTYAGGSAAR